MNHATIFWINGPVIMAETDDGFGMKESVTVGHQALAGEVIRLKGNSVTIQVFEDTTGLKPGDPVVGEGFPPSALLGPGMVGRMYDGIQRPLDSLAHSQGDFIQPGRMQSHEDETWHFVPEVSAGIEVETGTRLGVLVGDSPIQHQVLVPPGVSGHLNSIATAGHYTVSEKIAGVVDAAGVERPVRLRERWPIRVPRPVARRLPVQQPLVTGQRVLDTFFPVGKGGACALPGGFGTGKTVLEQTVAKWCDADVIVYIGCGERGNEMAGVLDEFPRLEDPRSGRPLMERTIVIANTSNMPVAAREASIYTGITIAEYFRDQGYHVALFADSISRWAESLREISGRLEELPAEEGYPSYMPSRLAEFFERAGSFETLGGQRSTLTVVATVSPPGGDFSEPVTSHTRRFVKSFWALDRVRAQARFYPAIDPLVSYTEYLEANASWWKQHGGLRWAERRERLLSLLQEQERLEKMVKIVGRDALPQEQRLTLFCAEVFVEGFLRQSAFSATDRFCDPRKQNFMLELMHRFVELSEEALGLGISPEVVQELPLIRRLQRVGEDMENGDGEAMAALSEQMESSYQGLMQPHREKAHE